MKVTKLKVTKISNTENPLHTIATACRLCYSGQDIETISKSFTEEENIKLIKSVLKKGHGSVSEHANITFGIEGISRVTTHQLVRHRVGCSYSQQSQRYVKFGDGEELPNILPASIADSEAGARIYYSMLIKQAKLSYDALVSLGIPAEDARYVLPNATETKIIVTMNFRALLHFFEERCCKRAQWEIRAMAYEMLRIALEVCPTVFENAGPICINDSCKQGNLSCKKESK